MIGDLARLVVTPAELGGVPLLVGKVTLLLAAAWLVQAAVGRLNPRWRVLVWRVTGIAIVLLCVLATSPPFVCLSILPGPAPELAARADLANPAVSANDTSGRDAAAPGSLATESEQLTQPDGPEGIAAAARLGMAHADRAPGDPHAVAAMPEQKPAALDDGKPAIAPALASSFWVLGLWCAGAGLCALWTVRGLLGLRAIRRRASSVPEWVECEAARAARAMGVVRGFELCQTQSLQTPCLAGVLRPTILLPAQQCEPRHSDELPAILAHELAHLKGSDLFWNACLNALAIGLWFHPLAWWMRLAHADACDAVCDALASDYVGDAHVYGRTLARLTLRITRAGATPGLAMARVSSVERRIAAVRRHVFRTGLSRRRVASAIAAASVAIAVLGELTMVPSQAEPPSAAKEQPSPASSKPQESPAIRSTASLGADDPRAGAKSPTLEKVFAAWKARQERVKSFYFAWNVRAVLPKGYQFPLTLGLFGVHRGDYSADPREIKWVGVALDAGKGALLTIPQWEWSAEGLDRLRSDFSDLEHSQEDGWKETGRYRVTRDGFLNSSLKVPTSSAEQPTIAIWRKVPIKHPPSNISRDDLWDDLATDQAPLRLAVRPLSPLSDWSPDSSRVVSEDALNGNVHCIELQMDKVDHSEQCWIDPKRDYSVVRWKRRQSDVAPLDVAIVPQQGPDGEWLPAQWSWRLPGAGGGAPASFVVTVTRRAINQKLPQKTFATDYPPGTHVYDASVDLPIYDSDDQSGMLSPDEARATLNAIADAWLKRQATVKRFKYNWRRDGERKTINMFCVDGEKFVSEFKTPDRTPPALAKSGRAGFKREGWPIHQRKTVFDGVDTRELWLTDNPNRPGGILNITAGSNQQRNVWEAGDGYLRLVFRPFDANFGGMSVAELRDPAKFRVRKQKGRIGSVACVVIETEEHPGMQVSYWLDPARDYIPLRQHRTDNGEDRERLEISYRADPTCGWAPVGWMDSTVRMGGGVYDPITDTVTELTVNQPIPASDFQIETAPNVKVQDWRNDPGEARRKAARAAWLAKRKPIAAAREAREKSHPRPKPKPVYDPFADAAADVEAACKLARETNKRVLIEFGGNWSEGSCELGVLLKENAEVSVAVKQDFVLVFVDSETEHGRQLHEKYVPKKQRNSIPHLTVLDASGKLLKNQKTTEFETDDDDYSVPKLKAFLAEWSSSK